MSHASLPSAEAALESSAFGESPGILEARRAFHRFALDVLVRPHLSSSDETLLDHVDLDDVGLRIALARTIDANLSGEPDLTAALEGLRHAASGPRDSGLFPLLWLDPATESRSTEESLRTILDEATRNDLTGVRARGELLPVDDSLRQNYQAACDLLLELDASLTTSVLPHAKACLWVDVGTGEAAVESGSARTMPGVVLLSARYLTEPFPTARAILHEAAHCKLFDLYLTRPILPADDALLTEYRVPCPWNADTDLQSNRWPIDQALAAAHVYVHLARLDALAPEDLRPRYTPDSAGRAAYLLTALSDLPDECLGVDGWDLVAWLQGCLEGATA